MNALIHYLLENMMIDFQGDLTLEMARGFLRNDDGKDARILLDKLTQMRSTDEMMISLADCLKEYLQSGINGEVVREQLRTYAES